MSSGSTRAAVGWLGPGLAEGLDGLSRLHVLIVEHLPEEWADLEPDEAAGRVTSTSGAKSDTGDGHVLTEIVRLDRGHHRPFAGDSPDAEAITLLARTHQSMIWDRTGQVLWLPSALREFFPAALQAFTI
jgi:hypothetical protein